MRRAISSLSVAVLVVGFVSLASARRVEAGGCEICRSVGSNEKLCQQTYDALYWRTGRTDCTDSGLSCFFPGECCYRTNNQNAACSVDHPNGCPVPKDCRIKEPLNQDF